jgi:hypothetical protein
MMLRPVQMISIFTIKMLVKYFNMPNSFLPLFKVLFRSIPQLIATVGIFPVVRVLWHFKGIISRGISLSNITNLHLLYPYLNTHVINNLFSPLLPYMSDCLRSPRCFKGIIYYSIVYTTLIFFKSLTGFIIKTTVGFNIILNRNIVE